LVDFQPVPVGLKPTPNLGVLMVRGVVLDENGPAAAIVGGEVMQEIEVGGSIEDGGLPIMEAGVPELDGAQDLHALALPSDGNLWGMADAAPSGVERGVLPKAGFVGEDQRPVLGAGFFLRRG
jgi:hypothetical protein